MAIVFDGVSYFDELKNINIKVKDRKITGIIGPCNSGKSCLVDLIGGNFLPSSGDVFFNDSVGIVYQNVEDQFFYDNIKDEFIFNLKINGVHDVYKKMNDAVKIVGFNSNILNKSIYELSLSEQKRISLAIVLAINPKIIVLDDLFFGLDGYLTNKLIRLIRLLKVRYYKTIIVVSNNSDLIHSLCDDIILISNGSILKYGDKYEIFTDSKLLKSCNLLMPDVIHFSNMVLKKKNINLGFRDDINDLVKDIYRFVR